MPPNDDPLDRTMDYLNKSFYREYGPAEYLFMRLNALCVVGGAFDAFKAIIVGGVEFGGARFKLPSDDPSDLDSVQAIDPLKDHFVRFESHHLKHLAIETLLRLYLGHKGLPRCPWIEMSKVTTFKDKVDDEIVNADPKDLQADVRQVILGQLRSEESLTEIQRDLSHNMAEILRIDSILASPPVDGLADTPRSADRVVTRRASSQQFHDLGTELGRISIWHETPPFRVRAPTDLISWLHETG